MKSTKTLIIIGNGIASWRVNEELEKKFVDHRILRIGSEEFAPKCSFRTTSVNCLRGTQKGISPLGDLIVSSHEEFVDFWENEGPEGVEKGIEWQLWDPRDQRAREKWAKRHPEYDLIENADGLALSKTLACSQSEAWFFDPPAFYQWQTRRLKNTEFLNDFVVSAKRDGDGFFVQTQGGRQERADKLFVCSGYMSHLFGELAEDAKVLDYLNRCKPVQGSYLAIKSPRPLERSTSLAFEGKHLIFRKSDQSILLGSTSKNGSSLQTPMEKELKEIYGQIKASLADPDFLPEFALWEKVNGVRHKGAKRMPFWGEMGANLYGMFGLYKNAFSFAFLGARELVEGAGKGAR